MRFYRSRLLRPNENNGRPVGPPKPALHARQSPCPRANGAAGTIRRRSLPAKARGHWILCLDCERRRASARTITEPGIPAVRTSSKPKKALSRRDRDIDGKVFPVSACAPSTHALFWWQENEYLPIGTAVRVTRTNDLMRGGSRLNPACARASCRAEQLRRCGNCNARSMV